MKPKALILTGYGINCENETQYAFNKAGADAEQVHINELIWGRKSLDDYVIFALPGGFAHGDFLGAGKVLAIKLQTKLEEQVQKYIQDGKLILGVCNGFQVLVKSGLLPGIDGDYQTQQVTLTQNDSARFEDRWVYLRINKNSPCIWTSGIEGIELPVRHGEGKFLIRDDNPSLTDRLLGQNLVAAQYAMPDFEKAHGQYPLNPNGSPYDIAAICDPTGRIFGIMPHPEGFTDFTNHPLWTRKKELAKRRGTAMPEEGGGMKIFRNAVAYTKENL
jgi:phosphoribosylformylglycinamidine synthase I